MSDVQLYGSNGIEQRRASRALARLARETDRRIAVVDAKAEIEAATVDGIAYVGTRAMQNVALVSQMEQSLAQAVPHASGRLATIADMTAIGMADVVASAGRRIRR